MGILSFLANLGIGSIVRQLASAYQAKQNAKTDSERIAADERIATLQAQAAVQQGDSIFGKAVSACVRFAFAAPFAIYYGKLVLWDKVMGWGATDPLSPELINVSKYVLGFYFVNEFIARLKR